MLPHQLQIQIVTHQNLNHQLPHQLRIQSMTLTHHAMQGEDDGSTLMGVPHYLHSRRAERPVGVYAVHDASEGLQYVGYSRNVVLSIQVPPPLPIHTHAHTQTI